MHLDFLLTIDHRTTYPGSNFPNYRYIAIYPHSMLAVRKICLKSESTNFLVRWPWAGHWWWAAVRGGKPARPTDSSLHRPCPHPARSRSSRQRQHQQWRHADCSSRGCAVAAAGVYLYIRTRQWYEYTSLQERSWKSARSPDSQFQGSVPSCHDMAQLLRIITRLYLCMMCISTYVRAYLSTAGQRALERRVLQFLKQVLVRHCSLWLQVRWQAVDPHQYFYHLCYKWHTQLCN